MLYLAFSKKLQGILTDKNTQNKQHTHTQAHICTHTHAEFEETEQASELVSDLGEILE